jgi:AraC-like DNA-binding protein
MRQNPCIRGQRVLSFRSKHEKGLKTKIILTIKISFCINKLLFAPPSRTSRNRKDYPMNFKSPVAARDIYQRLCHAREFIDACYHLPLDLSQIARQACFSPYHFLRLFRQAFNKTPHQYLTERRIEKAKQLLVSSDLSVTAVCFEVGFQSLGSFSSLFHKYVGLSPTFYRAKASPRILVSVLLPEMTIPACFLLMFGPRELPSRQF